MKNLYLTILLIATWLWGYNFAYSNNIIINPNIYLLRDSSLSTKLISSLNEFLNLKDSNAINNQYIPKSYLLETMALLDEMKDIEKSGKYKDPNFYKAYLTNLIPREDSSYIIQLSYIGHKDTISYLRASFRFLAEIKNSKFYFYSPLKENIQLWKETKFGSTSIYYRDKINIENAKQYLKYLNDFDKILQVPISPIIYYSCDNYEDALKLIGIEYKSDYNGLMRSSLNSQSDDSLLVINGSAGNNFNYDPHDLFHSRLRRVVQVSKLNKAVDEGFAFLYGGSWGMTWNEILIKFINYANQNPNANWIKLYKDNIDINSSEKNKPLNIDYLINALIIEKVMKEKGIVVAKQLALCGKREPEDKNYFESLDKLLGIKQEDFNREIWKLIKAKQ